MIEFPIVYAHLHVWDINKLNYPWREEIKQLSAFPNVYCKVSSLATEADHKNWTIEDLRPFVDHIFTCFGFERTVFGGDWPVSSQAAALPVRVEPWNNYLAG